MIRLITLLLICIGLCSHAQTSYRYGSQLNLKAPASGGGVSGPPGINTSVTNAATSTTSMSTNLTVSGANTALLMVETFGSVTLNTPTWNGSSTGIILLTNCFRSGTGHIAAWMLMNPAAGTFTVQYTWGSASSSATTYTACLTNCSGFEQGNTNFSANVGTTAFSTTATSQTKDLMFLIGSLGTDTSIVTPGAGQTLVSHINSVTGGHSCEISTQTGTASTDSGSFAWSAGSGNPAGEFYVGAIGF